MHNAHKVTITLSLARALRLSELLSAVAKDPNFTAAISPSTGRTDYRAAWSEMHRALVEASNLFGEAASALVDYAAERSPAVVPVEVRREASYAPTPLDRKFAQARILPGEPGGKKRPR